MIGQTISHYKITEKLGEGGMGRMHISSWIWRVLRQTLLCLSIGATLPLCAVNLSAKEWIICDREVTSYYVPEETRRFFNKTESWGFRYRLRLVVELFPKKSVLDVTDSTASADPRVDLSKLRDSLNHCLTCQPTKRLLERAIQEHGPEKTPSEDLTKAFSKSLHECLDEYVPQSFTLSVDLVCDRKFRDWL